MFSVAYRSFHVALVPLISGDRYTDKDRSRKHNGYIFEFHAPDELKVTFALVTHDVELTAVKLSVSERIRCLLSQRNGFLHCLVFAKMYLQLTVDLLF